MITACVVAVAFLVLCFFYCLKKRKIRYYFDAVSWLTNFFMFGLAGVFLGTIISFALGNFVVPSEAVLIETCVLEPVIVKDKEVFAIKNNQSYFYFTKGELDDCLFEMDSILLEDKDKDIKFGETKRMLNKYKKTPKGNLKWFFFSSCRYAELLLLSREDIL